MPSMFLMPTSRHPVAEEPLHLLLVSGQAVAPLNIFPPEAPLWEHASVIIHSDKLLPKNAPLWLRCSTQSQADSCQTIEQMQGTGIYPGFPPQALSKCFQWHIKISPIVRRIES